MLPVNRDILKLAVPSILANFTIPLVGIVDTAIVGHLSDAAAIGGIAIGTMLFDLLYWNFGFLRISTSGLTAQAFGRGTGVKDECGKILTQSVSIALMGAAFVWAIQWLFVTAVLAVVPCSPEVAEVARSYFFVRIWAAPATLSLMALKGWFIGMQDTKSAMAVDIVVNVINMAASYYLAVYTPLGVVGVAWGTLIAQYSGLILAVFIVVVGYRLRVADHWKEVLRWSELRRMMALNGNLFIRSLCFMVVYVGFTSLASRYGDTELAVSSIIMKLFMFFSYFVDGFAYAGEALVGKAIGESKGKSEEVRGVVRALFYWAIGVGLVFTVIYAVWGQECMALMTNDATILRDGIYVGATAGVSIRNAMIWAAVGFVLLYGATYRWVGAQALYIAYFAHLIARVIYLSVEWKKLRI